MSFFGSDGDITLIFQKPTFPIPIKPPSLQSVRHISNYGETEEGWEEVKGLHNSFLEALKWVSAQNRDAVWEKVKQQYDARNLKFGTVFDWDHIGEAAEEKAEGDYTGGLQIFSSEESMLDSALRSSELLLAASKRVMDNPEGFAEEMKAKRVDPQNVATLSLIFREGIKEGVVDGYQQLAKAFDDFMKAKADESEDEEKEQWEIKREKFKEVSGGIISRLGDEKKVEEANEKVFKVFNNRRLGRHVGLKHYTAAAFQTYYRKKREYATKRLDNQREQMVQEAQLAENRRKNREYLKRIEKQALERSKEASRALRKGSKTKRG